MTKSSLAAVFALCLLVAAPAARASYGIYVGRNLTADGSVFLGGTGDEPSSHWLEIVPRTNHAAGETIHVGMEKEANFPGELIEIPQVPVTAKYITMNYSEFLGLPAPLTNGGFNRAADALTLGGKLLGSIEARHRLLYGYRAPTGADVSTRGHRWGVSVDCRGGKE